jgi:hypothetical protein
MIARGIDYPDFTRTIALAEEIKNRREYNRLGALDQQMRQQQFEANQQQATQEQEKLRQDQQFAILIPMAEKGNEAAIDELAKRVDGLNPAAGIAFRTDPAQRAEALKVFRQQFGIPAEKVPGEMAVQRFPGFGSVLTQGGEYKGSRPDPAPQQPQQPTSEVRNWQFRQSLPPDQRAEYDRLYGKDSGGGSRPLPTSALRIVDEAQQAVAASAESKALVGAAIAKLEGGQVKLVAVRNLESRGRNFAGASNENSRAYADIRQSMEKLRNNYLLLAKGVQTEGDAQRAWNSEIGEHVQNDNALALQQMKKAQGMVDRAIEAQNARIETVYENFGTEPPTRSAAPGGVVDFNDL